MESCWTPRSDAELTAGWRLWLELSTQIWPDATWDGTPADAIRRLRELFSLCDTIQSDFLAESGAEKSAEIVGLLQSMVVAAATPMELWWDDTYPLDEERTALLHADLACFADHAEGVRRLLAVGGGWTSLSLTAPPR
jgi:hypothetical protein